MQILKSNKSLVVTSFVLGSISLYNYKNESNEINTTSEITLKSYYSNVADVKIDRGVNASSIADISGIPRATVIRKLNWQSRKSLSKLSILINNIIFYSKLYFFIQNLAI